MTRDARLRRWRQWWRRDTLETRLDEEIQFHLDQEIARHIAAGMPAVEARRLAIRKFGAPEIVKDRTRDEFRFAKARESVRNLRFVARRLRRSPGFSATAILTLALGIGAVSAIFSVVYGVLLKPLAFYQPERLVALYHVTPASQTDSQPAAAYFTYRDNGRVFEDIGLWQTGTALVTRNGAPEQVQTVRVTDGTLSLLGVQAESGRLIRKEDDAPGTPLHVVLTHPYSQQLFGGSTNAVGQLMTIDGKSCEIIGVLPASFKLLETDPQILLPLRLNRASTQVGAFSYNGLARLKTGVTLEQANADIARMIPLIAKQFPLSPGFTQQMWDSIGLAPNVRPLAESIIGEISRPLWILLVAVALVLLLAWVNVANLLLVRAEARQREFAVRGALGASRGHLVVEMLSETLMLGLAGGAVGVLLAEAGIGLLRRIAPAALPRVADIGIDSVVLLVTLAISVVTSLLFGLVPLVRSRSFSTDVLKEAGRSASDSPRRHRTRSTLVVAQVALALVLLVVSGLMARTFIALRHVQPGFVSPREVQTFSLQLAGAIMRDQRQVMPTFNQMLEQLKRVPGVESVGFGTFRMDGQAAKAPIYVQGRPVSGLPPVGSIWQIGAGYFETLGNGVVAGRTIIWADLSSLAPVAVISENLAREYFGNPLKAIGQRISFYPEGPWPEIIGVVGETRANGLNLPPPRLVYTPMANPEYVSRTTTVLIRSRRVGTPGFVRELERAVRSVNPNVPLTTVRTLAEIEAKSMAQTSFAMVMLALASGVALALALVGVYGVVSYVAAERTLEIGIRMALGAAGSDVRRLFLRRGLALTAIGLALGIGVAMLLAPVMSMLLYGVAPSDPVTYSAVAILLGSFTLLATYLPARRASRMSPINALKWGH